MNDTPSPENFLSGLAEYIETAELPGGYSLEEFKNETDSEIFDINERVEALEKTVAEQAALIKRLTRRIDMREWGHG